jgi:hypothetical protein
MLLAIIHRPVFYLKHNVSGIGFCLRLQVGRFFYLTMETESSLRNVVLKNKQNGVFRQRQDDE